MTPVFQTVMYGQDAYGNGNCLDACLASLMDIPLWMVPPFYQMWGRKDRAARVDQWLSMFGLELEFVGMSETYHTLPDFYVASGRSPRDEKVNHAVVYSNGALAHDPHYSNHGLAGDAHVVYYLKPTVALDKVHPRIPLGSYIRSQQPTTAQTTAQTTARTPT